ncbi:flagellar assembly protein A [Schinkia sp. CFF1]
MERGIIFKAKTVDEAIEKGLKQLGQTKEEVTIEILKKGRKGILSLGSLDAEVRISSKSKPVKKETTFESTDRGTAKIGKVWVENGEIHCSDPDEGELYVHIPATIQLYKNNTLMKEKTTISEKDKLKLEFKKEEIPTKWSIELAKNKVTATIKVIPGSISTYVLRNQKPASEITLEATQEINPNLTLTTVDIHEKLKSMGVSYGIQEEQIEKACSTEVNEQYIIAQGEPPIEGKHGWLEYKVLINEGKRFKEREDGSIDFREGKDIPSITSGTDIAIIHDPVPGKEGKAVTGESIPPQPVLPLQVRVGDGAKIIDSKIVATSMGRPSTQKRGNIVIVNVVPKLEHQGDVSMSSGNIKFNGDILISGNIEEHMEITAIGNIEVKGTTSEAKLKAGQSAIHYSNVISSEIIAGNIDKAVVEIIKENQLLELLDIPCDLGVSVQSPSVMNSFIISSGDVVITKQGCYNCTIYALGAIEINGFLRGGGVFAGQGVTINEAGSKGGTPTFITVPHDQTIIIKNVFAETTIQIGKRRYKFTKDMTNIVARIDEEGGLAIR